MENIELCDGNIYIVKSKNPDLDYVCYKIEVKDKTKTTLLIYNHDTFTTERVLVEDYLCRWSVVEQVVKNTDCNT